jgi:hypothetical protein
LRTRVLIAKARLYSTWRTRGELVADQIRVVIVEVARLATAKSEQSEKKVSVMGFQNNLRAYTDGPGL